jgi:choline dehydrogenase-like flavoprotein
MIGKVSAEMLRPSARLAPNRLLSWLAAHSVDCFAMSEDLPHPESRVRVDGERITLDWRRTNVEALTRLLRHTRRVLRDCGFPVVFVQRYTEENPGHQCGTVRMGLDPATAPLDAFCRAYDQPNLFVVDASFLPNSAAVNPSLTIIARALRVAAHIREQQWAAA